MSKKDFMLAATDSTNTESILQTAGYKNLCLFLSLSVSCWYHPARSVSSGSFSFLSTKPEEICPQVRINMVASFDGSKAKKTFLRKTAITKTQKVHVKKVCTLKNLTQS